MAKLLESSSKEYVAVCSEKLRASGYRLTRSRSAILSKLGSTKIPLSARDLFASFENDSSGKIDQVTVYRTLQTLEKLALVHQVFPSGGFLPCFRSRCEKTMHILISCSACDRTTELEMPTDTLAPLSKFLKTKHGFYPNENMFQVNGTCNGCST